MSILTVIISTIVRNNSPISGKIASTPVVSNVIEAVENAPQITVILNGVIYDAEVLPNVGRFDIPSPDQKFVRLIDGEYTLTVPPYDLAGAYTTPSADLTKDSAACSIVSSECTEADFLDKELRAIRDCTLSKSNFVINDNKYFSLAEPRSVWIPQSTREQSSKRASMTVRNSSGRIVLPSSIVLTPRVMLGVLEKLPTNQIEETIEGLLLVLDHRYGDPDLEANGDLEFEVDEENIQPI